MEYYSAIKKQWDNALCNNMDGPRDYHTEWSKLDKDKYHVISLIREIENDTKELIHKTERNRLKDFKTKLMVTKEKMLGWGEGKLGGWDWQLYTTVYKIDR